MSSILMVKGRHRFVHMHMYVHSDLRLRSRMGEEDEHWLEMWQGGDIPWHRDAVDSFLKKHLHQLTNGKEHASILVTLCGKSLDLPWLCSQGHTVVGAELSELAGKLLFEENNIPYSVKERGIFKVFVAKDRNLTFYAGDFFVLTPATVGQFDGVWDHHALGAINPGDRARYIAKLSSLLKAGGRILLSNFEHDESRKDAPYSLPSSLIKQLFGDEYEVELKDRVGPDNEFLQKAMKQLKVGGLYHPIHLLTKRN